MLLFPYQTLASAIFKMIDRDSRHPTDGSGYFQHGHIRRKIPVFQFTAIQYLYFLSSAAENSVSQRMSMQKKGVKKRNPMHLHQCDANSYFRDPIKDWNGPFYLFLFVQLLSFIFYFSILSLSNVNTGPLPWSLNR